MVFLHGLAGFVRLFGVAYFRDVIEDLRQQDVPAFAPRVHPTASISYRAQQIHAYLESRFGSDPVHLVGHSMGGLDARYLASPNGLDQGDRIITITTLATPHRGSWIARLARQTRTYRLAIMRPVPLRSLQNADRETRLFYEELRDNRWEGVHELVPSYLENIFNPQVVDHTSVTYFSFAGKMGGRDGAPIWPPLAAQWILLRVLEGPNDGLVSVESSRWGTFLGTLPASHVDLVGHLYPRSKIPFDRIRFYRSLVAGLSRVEHGDELQVRLS